MKKIVLVTAGCTSEKVDGVRWITNTATGKLGSLVADAFTKQGAEVVYLCGQGACQPSVPVAETKVVTGVLDVQAAVQQLSQTYKFDCIVHSMAVSDYTVQGVADYTALKQSIQNGEEEPPLLQGGKLSSNIKAPVILLQKAPKVIGEMKTLQPGALLVGFKLLVNTSEENLLAVATALLEKNNCDYVLANDTGGITATKHKAFLLDKAGNKQEFATKQEIAEGIVQTIENRWRAL